MPAFDVDASLFSAAALFQSTEETRFYLQGVQIEPHPDGGVFLVATDGHRVLVCHDKSGVITDGPVICRLDKDQIKACKADRSETASRRVVATDAASPANVVMSDGSPVAVMPKWRIDGTFPDWRRAMAYANCAGGHDAFDASLFASFVAAARIVGDTTKISIETGFDGGPSLIRFANVDHVVGALMPLRWKSNKGFPSFLGFQPNPPPEPIAAEPESEAA